MTVKTIISTILAASQIGGFTPSLPPVDSYDGEGMTIAIIDRGFELEHETFHLTDNDPRITKELSDSLLPETAASGQAELPESLYVSPKIPFAYDYGDGDSDVSDDNYNYHGTALLSIAAGNQALAKEKMPEAAGIAPEAQILAMKVYSEMLEDVTEDAMCAAIEDSLLFGADVILIGITDMCGFENSEKTARVNAAIDKAEAAGVIVVTAAGNVMTYGTGNVFDRELSIPMTPTSQPDVGTVSWPGSVKSTLCVTSADSNSVESYCFTLSDGTRVPYSDSNQRFEAPTNGKAFSEHFASQTLEYVITEGVGKPEELAGAGDLTGKLAVIMRGEITFVEKATNAAKLGAVGVIVIDTDSDVKATLTLNAELTGATIPLIIIPRSSAPKLTANANKLITVKSGETVATKIREKPSPAGNAAYGTTPELGLKPDIAAIGYNVACASYEGGYAYMSSTTAAAAKVAGMCTLVKAYFADRLPGISASELMNITKTVLVGSAQLMSPSYSSAYSPRIQGGGIADLDAAMNTTLLLSSNGSYKIELGDSHEHTLEFEITAHNLSVFKKSCKLDAIIGSDGYDEFPAEALYSGNGQVPLYERLGYESADTVSFLLPFTDFENAAVTVDGETCQLNTASDGYSPLRFVLEPGESRTFSVKVTLDEETYSIYREKFENGFFIEGFMRLTAGKDSASIPLVAFSGDFGDSPALDEDIFSGKQSIYDQTYLYTASNNSISNILGRVIGETAVTYDRERIVFSPVSEGHNSSIMLNLALLRSVYDVNITVSRDGEVISSKDYGDLSRTHYSIETESIVTPKLFVWDGRADDNSTYVYPDGDYTVTVSFRTVGSDEKSSISYNLTIDSTPPTFEDCEIISESDTAMLYVKASDNYSVDNIYIRDSDNNNAEYYSEGVWDIGNLTGKYIYINISDTAFNSKVTRIENPGYIEPEV